MLLEQTLREKRCWMSDLFSIYRTGEEVEKLRLFLFKNSSHWI